MNIRHGLVLISLFLVAAAGCASEKKAREEAAAAANVESVRVLVEGRERGYTPMTLSVHRLRGEYTVTLMKGRTPVRVFEIGHGADRHSPERHAIDMNLSQDNSGLGFRTFDLGDLDTANDTLYRIPYFTDPISVDDYKYGLTLVIGN